MEVREPNFALLRAGVPVDSARSQAVGAHAVGALVASRFGFGCRPLTAAMIRAGLAEVPRLLLRRAEFADSIERDDVVLFEEIERLLQLVPIQDVEIQRRRARAIGAGARPTDVVLLWLRLAGVLFGRLRDRRPVEIEKLTIVVVRIVVAAARHELRAEHASRFVVRSQRSASGIELRLNVLKMLSLGLFTRTQLAHGALLGRCSRPRAAETRRSGARVLHARFDGEADAIDSSTARWSCHADRSCGRYLTPRPANRPRRRPARPRSGPAR